jgi:hypothetical protein
MALREVANLMGKGKNDEEQVDISQDMKRKSKLLKITVIPW